MSWGAFQVGKVKRTFCELLLVVALAFYCSAGLSEAEELVIGFTDLPKQFDMVRGRSVASLVLRQAVSDGLLYPIDRNATAPHGTDFALALSDSVRMNFEERKWSFRLRPDSRFHSGERVSVPDVIGSLRRCSRDGFLRGVEKISERTEKRGPLSSNWVDVVLTDKYVTVGAANKSRPGSSLELNSKSQSAFWSFGRRVADCPILEKDASDLFGSDLGLGTNFVSSGPYELVDFHSGSSLRLKRFREYHGTLGAVEDLYIRGFRSGLQGLTALRMGTAAVLFTNDVSTLEKASNDETLLIDSCHDSAVVYRRGVNLVCNPNLRYSLLKYHS